MARLALGGVTILRQLEQIDRLKIEIANLEEEIKDRPFEINDKLFRLREIDRLKIEIANLEEEIKDRQFEINDKLFRLRDREAQKHGRGTK